MSDQPVSLPLGEELLAGALQGGDLDGRALLAALLVASARPAAVLDVGCRSGWLLGYLERTTGAATLVGVDRDRGRPPLPGGRARSRAAGLEPLLVETRGGWSDVLGVPLLYASTRLGVPMPARSWFRRQANRAYGRPGRYTHFVVARRPEAAEPVRP